ncbi:MAG: RNA polymerase sigma-70 factor [Crocinitomicaceae bacterium]
MEIKKTLNIGTFETLFKRYYSELCGFANKYLQDLEAAEEIVQAFFVKYWEKREQYSEVQFKKAYFYSSIKNACLNQLKHIEVREAYKIHNQREMEAKEFKIDDELEANELSEKIRQSIDSLPEGRRKIFIMSRYDGLKYKEIANQLKISIKTVENQMGSALKHLKVDLAEYLTILIIILFRQLP